MHATNDRENAASWPRVSVVTPSFNQARFIEETIRSVLLQGYPNLEYIIIDGGSTDGSVEIIKKYEQWLAFWVSEKDNGQSDAINKGWRRSTGAFIAWLNSDDCYLPGAISREISAMRLHADAGMIYGDCEIIDDDSVVTGVITRQRSASILQAKVYQPASIYRRACLDKAGWLDPSLHYVMDTDWWWRINLHMEVVYIPHKLARYRRWTGAKTIGVDPTRYYDELCSVTTRFFDDYLPTDHEWQQERNSMLYRTCIAAARACFHAEEWNAGVAYLEQALAIDSDSIKLDLDRITESLVFLTYNAKSRSGRESLKILDDILVAVSSSIPRARSDLIHHWGKNQQLAESKIRILMASDKGEAIKRTKVAADIGKVMRNDPEWLVRQRGRVFRALMK